MEYIHRELNRQIEEEVLETVYILDGVSTVQSMEQLLLALLENLRVDLSMRRDIVSSMQKATTDQMGVYASAWKYGPCVDSELRQRFQSLLENELCGVCCTLDNKVIELESLWQLYRSEVV